MKLQNKVTVFGATGKVGRELLQFLSASQTPVIAVTRSYANAFELPFVEWREADLSNEDSLAPCVEGSAAIYLSSSFSPDFVKEQFNAIAAAKQAKVGHIVRLSSVAADETSVNFIARLSGETDLLLMKSGIPYTILKPNAFMQNWIGDFSETIKKERKIYEAAGDGRRAYIDTRDIAEVAFRILGDINQHRNKVYQLTGSQAISFRQVADAIGQAIGEIVTYIPLTLDEAKTRMEKRKLPAFLIDTFLSIASDLRKNHEPFVSRVTEEILGKPARTVVDFANDNAAFFK